MFTWNMCYFFLKGILHFAQIGVYVTLLGGDITITDNRYLVPTYPNAFPIYSEEDPFRVSLLKYLVTILVL